MKSLETGNFCLVGKGDSGASYTTPKFKGDVGKRQKTSTSTPIFLVLTSVSRIRRTCTYDIPLFKTRKCCFPPWRWALHPKLDCYYLWEQGNSWAHRRSPRQPHHDIIAKGSREWCGKLRIRCCFRASAPKQPWKYDLEVRCGGLVMTIYNLWLCILSTSIRIISPLVAWAKISCYKSELMHTNAWDWCDLEKGREISCVVD